MAVAISHYRLRHPPLSCGSSVSSTLSAAIATRRLHFKYCNGNLRGAVLKSGITRSTLESKSSARTAGAVQSDELVPYTPGLLDDVFMNIFRGKMAEEVGWDSSKSGYDGLIDVAKRLLVHYRSGEETERATVTLATCQWLMGRCTLTEVELADGSKIASGVLVQKCKYLDETKCAGICIHTCKLPTQAFMYGDMGVLLTMEPNYEDFSCQFKFGVKPLPTAEDPAMKTPCLAVCPTATSRGSIRDISNESQCPQVTASL